MKRIWAVLPAMFVLMGISYAGGFKLSQGSAKILRQDVQSGCIMELDSAVIDGKTFPEYFGKQLSRHKTAIEQAFINGFNASSKKFRIKYEKPNPAYRILVHGITVQTREKNVEIGGYIDVVSTSTGKVLCQYTLHYGSLKNISMETCIRIAFLAIAEDMSR